MMQRVSSSMRRVVVAASGVAVQPMPDACLDCLEADDVLVRVTSAGVNRADVMEAERSNEGAPLGLEFAGLVEAIGSAVAQIRVGTRVMGLVPGGGQASHVVVPAAHCIEVPDGLALDEAGAIPEVFITAWDALNQAGFSEGDRVLINGVGSGVGTAAVQLIRLAGGVSVGTSRSDEKLARCVELGLTEPIRMVRGKPETEIQGIDIVLELLGGAYLSLDLAACNPRARIVVIGRVAGASAELDIGAIMFKRLRILGTALRPRSEAEKTALARRFAIDIVPNFVSRRLRPVVSLTLPLEDAPRAYAAVRNNELFGKAVLLP